MILKSVLLAVVLAVIFWTISDIHRHVQNWRRAPAGSYEKRFWKDETPAAIQAVMILYAVMFLCLVTGYVWAL